MKVAKVIKIGDSFGIVIPKQYMRMLGWQIGDYVTQQISDGRLLLTNVYNTPVTFERKPNHFDRTLCDRVEQPIPESGDSPGPDRRTDEPGT